MKRIVTSKWIENELDGIYDILDEIHSIQNKIDDMLGDNIDSENIELLDTMNTKLDEFCAEVYKRGYRGKI